MRCKMEEHICNYQAFIARERFRYVDDSPELDSPTCPQGQDVIPKSPSFPGNLCCTNSQICDECSLADLHCASAKPIYRGGDPCAGVTGYYRQSLCRRHGRPIDIPNLHPPMFLPPFWANDPSYHERYPLYQGIYKRELEEVGDGSDDRRVQNATSEPEHFLLLVTSWF